jgi:hypothetical protein
MEDGWDLVERQGQLIVGQGKENWWRRRESNPESLMSRTRYRGGIAQKNARLVEGDSWLASAISRAKPQSRR